MKTFSIFGYKIVIGRDITPIVEIDPKAHELVKTAFHVFMEGELKHNGLRAVGVTPIIKGDDEKVAKELLEELRHTWPNHEFEIERAMHTSDDRYVIRPRLKT